MRRLILLPEALADLDAIFVWTAEHWSQAQALKYLDILNAECLELTRKAAPGRPCGYLLSGLRRQEVGGHVVFFLEDERDLTVARILHKRQSPRQHLSDKSLG